MEYPMNLIRSVLTVSLMLFFFTTGNSSAFEFSFGSRFLDYGNGAINLDRVTHVRPTIKFGADPDNADKALPWEACGRAVSVTISKLALLSIL
jgi:hypothetical protein